MSIYDLEIPWQFKIIILILGLFYYPLGAILLMMDARFHTLSSQKQLENESPDWIIARFFNKKGLPKWMHTIMGLFLGISTIAFVYYVYYLQVSNRFTGIYMQVLYSAFLFMIITAIFLKNYLGGKGTVAIL